MSGGFIAAGRCFACGEVFSFNPTWVPSVPIDPRTNRPLDVDAEGNLQPVDPIAELRAVKRPICEDCITLVNARRSERGEDPIYVSPHAYELEQSF